MKILCRLGLVEDLLNLDSSLAGGDGPFNLFSSVIPAVQGAGRGSSRQAGVCFGF